MTHIKATGSKAEVFHGTAKHTSGGLHKKDLMKHKGRIISRKKHAAGKKAIKHLFSLGYKPSKGTFRLMRKSMSKKSRRHTRKRGGNADVAGALGGVMKALSGAVDPTAAAKMMPSGGK